MKIVFILLFIFSSHLMANCPLPDFNLFDPNLFPENFFQENCSEKKFLEDSNQLCECSQKTMINKFDNKNAQVEAELAMDYYRYFESSLLSISNDISEIGKNSSLTEAERNSISQSCLLDKLENIQCEGDSNLKTLENKLKENPVSSLRSKIINELAFLNAPDQSLYNQVKNESGLMLREIPSNSCTLPDSKLNDIMNKNLLLTSIEISDLLKNYQGTDFSYNSIYKYLESFDNFSSSSINVLNSKSSLFKSIFSSDKNTAQFFKALKDGNYKNIDEINNLLNQDIFKTDMVNNLIKRCDTTFNEFQKFLCNPTKNNKVSNFDTFKRLENIKRTSKPKLNKQPLPPKEIEKVNEIVDVHEKIEWYCAQEKNSESDFEKSFNDLYKTLPNDFQIGGLQPQTYSANAYSEIKNNRELLCSATPPKGEIATKLKELNCPTVLTVETNYDCRMLLLYQMSLGNGQSDLLGKNQMNNEEGKSNDLVISFIGNTSKYSEKEINLLKKSGLYKEQEIEINQKKMDEDIVVPKDEPTTNNNNNNTNFVNNNAKKDVRNTSSTQVSQTPVNSSTAKNFKDEKRKIQEEIINKLLANQEKSSEIMANQNDELRKIIQEDPKSEGLSESDIDEIIKKYQKTQKQNAKKIAKNNDRNKSNSKENTSNKNNTKTTVQTNPDPNTNITNTNVNTNTQPRDNTNNPQENDSKTTTNNFEKNNVGKNIASTNTVSPMTSSTFNNNSNSNGTSGEAPPTLKVDEKNNIVKLSALEAASFDMDTLLNTADKNEINKLDDLIKSGKTFVVTTKDGFEVEIRFESGTPTITKKYKEEKPEFKNFEAELIEYLTSKRKNTLQNLNTILGISRN
jgi:hypothetical protein